MGQIETPGEPQGGSGGYPPATPELRRPWQRWVDVVERFARRERKRRSIAAEDYQQRHQELLQACQAALRGERGRERAERMLGLARPWLNLDLLETAGPTTLHVLLRDCQQIEQELGCRRRWRLGPGTTLPLGLLVVAGILGVWWWPQRDWLLTRLWLAWRPIRATLRDVTFGEWLVVAGLGAAVLGFLFIWRARPTR